MRGIRRGVRRWFWIVFVALPLAGWACLNLWLASPPGRNWIAGKIHHRTGLETRIGGASVSPWNGVRLHHVELLQPPPLRTAVKEPLAGIKSIRLIPVWRSWLSGNHELQSIEIDSPQLTIPLELIADLARSQTPATPPPVAAVTPGPATPPAPLPETPAIPPAAPQTPPQVPTTPLQPTFRVYLENASIRLISASSGKSWFQVSGISGSIPIAGSPADSTLRVASVEIAGRKTLADLKTQLNWTPPLLSLNPFETEIQGIKFTLAGKIAMLSGLPLQIEAQAPKQKPPPIQLPADGQAGADAVAANARFRGLLTSPGTWQGDLVVETLSPFARIGKFDAKFDRGGAVTVLRGGLLSCVDARLIGDDLSFLGNATLLADGRAAAVLRMVAPPENATSIASRVFPDIGQSPALTDLGSPQRVAFDLEAFGNISQIFLRLGRNGPVVELKQ